MRDVGERRSATDMDNGSAQRMGDGGSGNSGAQGSLFGYVADASGGAESVADGAVCESCRGILDGHDCGKSVCGERWLRTGEW